MKLFGSVAAPLALSLLVAGCGGATAGDRPGAARGPVEVGVVTLEAHPVTTTAELTGRTTATMVSEVRPQVDGVIKARLFTEGSLVRAGQPLYQIDARLYRASRDEVAAQLVNAQAASVTAQAKLARYRQLTDLDAVSRQDVDDATATARQSQASVQQYRASLRTADVNLGFTRVYAPISGRIGRSAFTQGALVTAAQTTALATIQQLDPIYVDIQHSSDALIALRESLAKGDVLPASAAVQLILGSGRAYPQAGTVQFGEVSVDENSGTVTLRARFPSGWSPARSTSSPGLSATVAVPSRALAGAACRGRISWGRNRAAGTIAIAI
jgi:membrane fusion protein (multidrug efflux system)